MFPQVLRYADTLATVCPMVWTPISKPRHHLAHIDYQLRLIDKANGYLDVGSRQFLFDGERGGYIRFEVSDGRMSLATVLATTPDSVHVPRSGRLSVRHFTKFTSVKLPVSVLLTPVDGERRLLVSGVR